MDKLDDQIVKLANAYKITVDECPLKTWKRFPDDCFGIWKDSIEKLYQFLVDINKIHPRIKFTLENSSSFYCGIQDEHDCCRRAGRVNGGTIVLCRDRTERSRTIPSFRKKTNA